jgi:hypothetical protein
MAIATSAAADDGTAATEVLKEMTQCRATEKRPGNPSGGRASRRANTHKRLGRSLALPNSDPDFERPDRASLNAPHCAGVTGSSGKLTPRAISS